MKIDTRIALLVAAGVGLLLVIPRKAWALPPAGEPYRAWLEDASRQFDLPPLLLARVAWQESRFRPEIIDGSVTSKAGAVGIMQIIPRWHPGVDARDPKASIYYAASYLYHLHRRFGRWDLALAGYNLGPTGVDKLDGDATDKAQSWDLLSAPLETRRYVSQILNDVKVA